jgi:TorA maturation chaperone TorD
MIAKRHGARAALYGALAGTFTYPEESTVDELTHPETREAVERSARRLGYDEEATGYLDALASVSCEEFRAAHDCLFGIPEEGSYPVVPYEAHYTVGDDVGQKQRRIAVVSGLLEAFDLTRHREFADRRDHVAVELEAMQVLTARRVAAIEDGDDEAKDRVRSAEATLVAEHLVDFVPSLAHEIEAAIERVDRNDGRFRRGGVVYRNAATLASRLVNEDAARLPTVPDSTPSARPGGELR